MRTSLVNCQSSNWSWLATRTGIGESTEPPLPSWPEPLAPQHQAPLLAMPQAKLSPAASEVYLSPPSTGSGVLLPVPVPTPSVPPPQQ